jgi:signal transduction histidine kinase
MLRSSSISSFLRDPWTAWSSRWVIAAGQPNDYAIGAIVLGAIALASGGLFPLPNITLVFSVALVYLFAPVVLDRFFPRLGDYIQTYWYNVFGIILILIGSFYLASSRVPLWLLVVWPIWKLQENENVRLPLAAVIAATVWGGVVAQTAAELSGESWLLIATRSTSKALLLFFVWIGGHQYWLSLRRMERAADIRRALAESQTQYVDYALTLQQWCSDVLKQTVVLTEASYATFQTVNDRSGRLDLIAVAKWEPPHASELDPTDLDPFITITDADSEGVTGHVARTRQSLALYDVTRDNRYVPTFRNVVAEIAVPVQDLLSGRVGAILNVEYTGELRPESLEALSTNKATLEELSALVAPAYSFIRYYELARSLRQLGIQVTSETSVQAIAGVTVDRLASQFGCPIALWLLEPGDTGDYLKLVASSGLPSRYQKAVRTLPLATSLLGGYIKTESQPRYVVNLSSSTVDNWKTLKSMKFVPVAMQLVPLVGTDSRLGILQFFTFRTAAFSLHEVTLIWDLGRQVAVAFERLRREMGDRRLLLSQETTAIAHDLGGSLARLQTLTNDLISRLPADLPDIQQIQSLMFSELTMVRELTDLVNARVKSTTSLPRSTYLLKDIIAHATLRMVSRGQLRRDQIIIRDIPKDISQIICNRPIAVGALYNLLLNASQATLGKEAILISVSADTSGQFANIDVRNFGPPIPKVHMPNLFSAGFTTKAEGHGIGLGTYRSLIQQTGGDLLLLTSNEVGGTLFRLQLKQQGASDVD